MTSARDVPLDIAAHRALLQHERARTVERIAALTRDVDAFVETAELTNVDDEHDPEGQTIAYERAQAISLRGEATIALERLDAALAAIDDGTYGRCRFCGQPIGPERLAALPGVPSCIACAAAGRT